MTFFVYYFIFASEDEIINPKWFQLLIKAGVSLNLQDIYGQTALNLSRNDKIKKLINKYQSIRENIKRLQDLQSSLLTYLSIVPRDLISLIKNELEDESPYSI